MSHNAKIVIVEDDSSFASFLKTILEEERYDVKVFYDPETALKNIKNLSPNLIITDLKMPKMNGIEFIEKASDIVDTKFIVITAFGTIPSAVEAIKRGAVDYITKPLSSPEEFLKKIEKILKTTSHTEELEIPPYEILFAGIENVYYMIKEVAKTDTTVILYGETGTGKSAIAKAIHIISGKKGAFVEINCASIPETLIESELFGYEKGAFSGAIKQKYGKIELAQNGTLFLDEIGELTPSIQAKFLKVLQDKSFERVGGLETIKTNARFITATNRDLKQMVKDGKFREDLYFRLNVFPITIPPLRERKQQINKISEYLIEKISKKLGKEPKRLSKQSLELLKNYSFPGNIRELQNLLERAIILSKTEEIEIKIEKQEEIEENNLKSLEKKAIIEALKKTNGNKKMASMILGISLRTLYNKIKEFGLE
ncbi:DNA-binding transcriptional response regulator, NtrC family [Thermodesulfovibrio aggregans]|uniref:DNA-binding transcriptional response regulator, NtrC family n=1 Tax=Thermodesulfovibrio aggregans TaxID=86166 RepID=A0A0U9HRT4_9BACT|nr:sigma-54 dependent transcriptional regulator [Thermodesulfovibrio aggregans]GAQ95756.1 DNA-binding transcriptional response regulator, NtrC family [Thermodesulfovibrio aggregans]